MFWWNRAKTSSVPQDRPVSAYTNPELDLEALGPVVRTNHIAYVPAKEFSGVPGVGTGNLVYAPDFLLSAPVTIGGSATLRQANSIMIARSPAIVARPAVPFAGLGGLVAGQMVHQPLLEFDVADASAVGE